jgi:hypothetical protein
MKKIFIDATGIVTTSTGLGKYSFYLLKSLLLNKQYYFIILHQLSLSGNHPLFSLRNENVDFLQVKSPVIGPKRELAMFALRDKINQCNIYHCLNSYLPAFGFKISSIVTIHDLKYLLFPQFFNSYFKNLYYSWIIHRGIREAKTIVAVSESTLIM